MDGFSTNQIIVAIITFFLGNVTGYLLHDILKRTLSMSEEASKTFLVVTITLVWALSMLVDIASPTYDVPVAVHGILGAIVGFFFWRPKQ